MNLAENGLVCRIETVVSTVWGLVWSALRISSSVQIPQNDYDSESDCGRRSSGLPGFKALIATPTPEKETPRIVHSHTRALSSSSSSSSQSSSSSYSSNSFRSLPTFSSSVTGDLIGTESGVFMMMNSDGEDLMTETVDINEASNGKKQCRRDTRTREYPPILMSGDKPFALKRRCVDGRLIITKETPKPKQCQCHRVTENGRLLLYLLLPPPVETEEVEKEKGPFAMLASSMPEAYAVNKNWNWSSPNCGTGTGAARIRCFTYVGQGISDTNFFSIPPMNNAIYT